MARTPRKHVRRDRRRLLIRTSLAAGLALTVTTPAVAAVWPEEEPVEASPVRKARPVVVEASPVPMRVEPISRAADRVELEAKPEARRHMFATEPVNVRAKPRADSPKVGLLASAERVGVTGERRGPWVEVVVREQARWVHGAYLARTKPRPKPEPAPEPKPQEPPADPAPEPEPEPKAEPAPAPEGLSTAPCASGSSVESGLVPNAIAVHRAVCAAFPSVTSYLGARPGDGGFHGSGQALDIMVSGSTGDQVAEFARSHASALGVSEVIWSQRIWTVQRASEGWRWMEDRGSTTANHYDHVHVSVY